MKTFSKVMVSTLAIMAASTMAAYAADKTISMIECGDTIAETYPELIAKWEAANPGYKVDVQMIGWAQCQDKATTLAAAGDPVALAYMGSRVLKQLSQNDLIVPIPYTDEEKASYYPHIVDTVTSDGQQWGLPVAFSTKALFWNKKLFEAAGLDPNTPPKTWDELYDMAKTIKDKTGTPGYGLPAKTMDNTMHQFLHYVYTNDGQVIDADGNIVLDSPQNREALQFYKKLVDVAEEGPTAYEQDEMIHIFNDGQIAMLEQGPWVRVQAAEGLDWGVAALPTGPQAKGPGTLLITDSLAVFKGSGVEEQAIDLAKFLTNPENQFAYEKMHGLTPLRPVPGVADLVKEDPTWAPFLDGIANGGPEPLMTDYKGMQDAFIQMIQSVVTDQASPADALKTAQEALESLE